MIRREVFRMSHDLHKVRDFRPVLCANVWGYFEDYAVRQLERFVATEWREAGGGSPSPGPLVTSRPRGLFPSPGEPRDGVTEHVRWAHPWAPNGLGIYRKKTRLTVQGPKEYVPASQRKRGHLGTPTGYV